MLREVGDPFDSTTSTLPVSKGARQCPLGDRDVIDPKRAALARAFSTMAGVTSIPTPDRAGRPSWPQIRDPRPPRSRDRAPFARLERRDGEDATAAADSQAASGKASSHRAS